MPPHCCCCCCAAHFYGRQTKPKWLAFKRPPSLNCKAAQAFKSPGQGALERQHQASVPSVRNQRRLPGSQSGCASIHGNRVIRKGVVCKMVTARLLGSQEKGLSEEEGGKWGTDGWLGYAHTLAISPWQRRINFVCAADINQAANTGRSKAQKKKRKNTEMATWRSTRELQIYICVIICLLPPYVLSVHREYHPQKV